MTLQSLDNDLELCKKFIENHSNEIQINDFLTKFMLIHLSSEYDKIIKKSVSDKAINEGNLEMLSFIDGITNTMRNFKTDDIKAMLNRFHSKRELRLKDIY